MERHVGSPPDAARDTEFRQRRQTEHSQAEQPVREPQLPLFRPRGRPRPEVAGTGTGRHAEHSGPETAPRRYQKGQGLQTCRKQPADMARPRQVQSRHRRTARQSGRQPARPLPGRIRLYAPRTRPPRRTRRRRHTGHAHGQLHGYPATPTDASTSASPKAMRSLSRQDWRPAA